MAGGEYLAIDWGTTNRRIYRMRADGECVDSTSDDRGVLAIDALDIPGEIQAMREAHGDLPLIAAGMVGSSRGWVEVPYVATPASLADVAAACAHPAPGVSIVPGVSHLDERAADVMRGEEVQVLGAVAAGLASDTALFCQPGTHCKWIALEDGKIARFSTAMTGELFALLRGRSILSEMLGGPVAAGPAFAAGLQQGLEGGDALGALFGTRARVLLGRLAREDAAAWCSGLLIGADVRGQGDLAGRTIYLLSAGNLADLYRTAIEHAGATVVAIDSSIAFLAGIHALQESIVCPA
ncbi:2-dehydro-3-deoxygalactonokinase [Aurantiacibacter luteus]|uniref:2-dehydro-3-deoxygalactonokinase n=1 Tax=Aurantiacibacter luteus TaxID=1581420 RepID=UPI000A826D21|nr:2-dehydro-3-deoxygalactonokinase [Aurantiacibacter luteus]